MGLLGSIIKAVKDSDIETKPEIPVERVAPTAPLPAVPMRPPRRTPPDGATLSPEYLNRALAVSDTMPIPARDMTKYLHVSSLIGGCPRFHAITHKYNPEISEPVISGMRLIWTFGKAAERHVRNALIGTIPGEVYGDWVCPCKWTVYVGVFINARECNPCSRCGEKPLEYREHTLFDDDLDITGSPDLIIVKDNVFTVVECKSVNEKGWKEREKAGKPSGDHSTQALYYRRMMVKKGHSLTSLVFIIYILKDYKWGKNPYMIFQVSEEGLSVSPSLDLMDEYAAQVKKFKATGGRLPSRLPVCKKSTDRIPKGCAVSTLCFNQ